MQDETRVAVISMIIDNEESAASINALLHDCREYIIGRMGIPYREKGLNIINVVLDAPMDAVSALSGKLGRLPGVTAKAVYSKLPAAETRTGIMSITRKVRSALAAVLCMGMLTACQSAPQVSAPESDSYAAESASAADSSTSAEPTAQAETTAEPENSTAPSAVSEEETPDVVRIAALKGPTAMGMIKLMDDESENSACEFTIAGAADELTPAIIQGNVDIACVPANLASVLYNKTEGGVKVLAVNTLGVLYIVENGEPTIAEISDLKGRTIYASGKGATPEYALNYLLTQNGIDPEKDVTIEWKTEHVECLTALMNDPGSAAMLPQPFVTTAQTKNENVNVVVDMNQAWAELNNGSALITGVVIARSEFAEQYPGAVDGFLDGYGESVKYVNSNVSAAAELIGKYDIVPAAVAEKALPKCNIVFITGGEMKEKLSGYLGVLFDSAPAAVGGALPGDDFYYGA